MENKVLFALCLTAVNFVQLTQCRHSLAREQEIPAYIQDRYTQAISDAVQYHQRGVYQGQGAEAAPVRSVPTRAKAKPPSQGQYKLVAIRATPVTPVYQPRVSQRESVPTQGRFSQGSVATEQNFPSGYKNEANILFKDLPEGGFDPAEYDQGTFYGAPESHGFGYAVEDSDNGNQFTHSGFSDGDTTNGEYRVLLPDGRTQVVTYSSNPKSGYMARVTYEGTAKPYVPPE